MLISNSSPFLAPNPIKAKIRLASATFSLSVTLTSDLNLATSLTNIPAGLACIPLSSFNT